MEFPIRFRKSISRELKSSPPLIEPSSETLIHRFIVSDANEWSLTFPNIIPKVVSHLSTREISFSFLRRVQVFTQNYLRCKNTPL